MRVEIIAFLLSNFGGGADTNACARRATEVCYEAASSYRNPSSIYCPERSERLERLVIYAVVSVV
jgi:hypothetical protein